MTTTAMLTIETDIGSSLKSFFRAILEQETIDALFIPARLPMKSMVMPTLIVDPDRLESIDPLAPAFALNAARSVARLTRQSGAGNVAAVLRPCEMRAFVELVKLNQGQPDNLVMIGFDCLGGYGNKDYFAYTAAMGDKGTDHFVTASLAGKVPMEKMALAPACDICEAFMPDLADLAIGLLGADTHKALPISAGTAKGEDLLAHLTLPVGDAPEQRDDQIEALRTRRVASRDACFEKTAAAIGSVTDLSTYLAHCVNCYNCRVACPVCYCKECVFVTDVFDHDAGQYLAWAGRKGQLKLPTDTLFYHLTRLAHMSTACVGCGQCSNACPNDIPVMELFRTVAHDTQAAFEYRAGRSIAETPPLATFAENELIDVVGIT